MSTSTVRNRSGEALPSKAERRALGKAAAAKRRAQARRRLILQRVGLWGTPVVVVAGIFVWVAASMGAFDKPFTLDPALNTAPTITAGSGDVTSLQVTPLIVGKGPTVASGQSITVNYIGATYADGAVFDSTWDSGQPFTLTIGVGQVIPGWDQGLVGQTVGSRVQLDIPSDLAYGDDTSTGAPVGDLRFIVDILSASDAASSAA